MASFSFKGNPILTDAEFNEMLSNDKQLRELCYAIGYQKVSSHETGYYVNYKWNECRDVTPEQMETARLRFEERREEVRKEWAVPGVLFIVTMGGDYTPSMKGGIGNHRVRIRFIDKKGDLRGAEFCPHWNTKGNPNETTGFTLDRWNTSEEERKQEAYRKGMDALEAKYKGKFIPVKERPEFPMTYADRGNVEDLPFTGEGLIKWLRREHKVRFKAAYVDRYFFGCDEIISEAV